MTDKYIEPINFEKMYYKAEERIEEAKRKIDNQARTIDMLRLQNEILIEEIMRERNK